MNADLGSLCLPIQSGSFTPMVRWGGQVEVGIEQAVLAFDDIVMRCFAVNIGSIQQDPTECCSMPSVIGRDVLSRWRVESDPRNGTLQVELNNCDWDDQESDLVDLVAQELTIVAHCIAIHTHAGTGLSRPGDGLQGTYCWEA